MNTMGFPGAGSRRFLAHFSILLAAGGVLPTAAWWPTAPEQKPPRAMPAFELGTLEGGRFSSAALAGKVVLVDLWATWCKPCVNDIPHWNKLQQRYREQGFTLLGITVQSGWVSDIREEIAEYEFTIDYPVVVGDEDIERAFGGVWGFPTAFLITRDGKIYKKYSGQYPERRAEIEADIRKLLSQEREEAP